MVPSFLVCLYFQLPQPEAATIVMATGTEGLLPVLLLDGLTLSVALPAAAQTGSWEPGPS
jgi:hypothetical protein